MWRNNFFTKSYLCVNKIFREFSLSYWAKYTFYIIFLWRTKGSSINNVTQFLIIFDTSSPGVPQGIPLSHFFLIRLIYCCHKILDTPFSCHVIYGQHQRLSYLLYGQTLWNRPKLPVKTVKIYRIKVHLGPNIWQYFVPYRPEFIINMIILSEFDCIKQINFTGSFKSYIPAIRKHRCS